MLKKGFLQKYLEKKQKNEKSRSQNERVKAPFLGHSRAKEGHS